MTSLPHPQVICQWSQYSRGDVNARKLLLQWQTNFIQWYCIKIATWAHNQTVYSSIVTLKTECKIHPIKVLIKVLNLKWFPLKVLLKQPSGPWCWQGLSIYCQVGDLIVLAPAALSPLCKPINAFLGRNPNVNVKTSRYIASTQMAWGWLFNVNE